MPARSGGVWVAVATAATYSPSQPGSTSTGNAGSIPVAPNGTGGCPAAPIAPGGGGVGQLASEMGEHGRVGVGVGQSDAQVDHPPAPGRLGDQLGVVGGVGHGGHGLDEGVQERAAADIGQLAGCASSSPSTVTGSVGWPRSARRSMARQMARWAGR